MLVSEVRQPLRNRFRIETITVKKYTVRIIIITVICNGRSPMEKKCPFG
jgi:hypothetical protein